MKKVISFALFIILIVITMQLLPMSVDGEKPGAGDIWWANVSEINDSYKSVSQK